MLDLEQETREELLRYLEQISGHSLHTRQDVDKFLAFMDEVHPHKADRGLANTAWLIAKRSILVALLAFGVFQYYAVEVVTEIMSIEKVKFLTPPPVRAAQSS